MSQQAVEKALGKLVTDEGFREEFFRNPGFASVRAGLELSREELDALLRISRRALATLAASLGDRICRLHVVAKSAREEQSR